MQITFLGIFVLLKDKWWYLNWLNCLNTRFRSFLWLHLSFELLSSLDFEMGSKRKQWKDFICRSQLVRSSVSWLRLKQYDDINHLFQVLLLQTRHKYRLRKQLGRAAYRLIFLCPQTMARKLNWRNFFFLSWVY